MSWYKPPEKSEEGSSRSPGVGEKGIIEQQESFEILLDLDRLDYALIALLLSIPAGALTALLVTLLFPEYQETAGVIVRWVSEMISDVLLRHSIVFDFQGLFSIG